MELSQTLPLLLLAMFIVVPRACSSPSGFRVGLTHVDSKGNFSKKELLRRAALRSDRRMSRLMGMPVKAAAPAPSGKDDVQAPVHAGNGEFLMDLAIGTPSLAYSAILDTGSDLIWTQCKPCDQCFTQPTAIFDPKQSSTYAPLACSSDLCEALPTATCDTDCEYLYSYGDASSTQGVLASETFAFGSAASVPGIAFGCGDENQGNGFSQGSGIVGLGRGPLSLISQLGVGKFSYCLTSLDSSKSSPLLFGSLADLGGSTSGVQSTPLVKNPSQPSFYYLNLTGVTVGSTQLAIPSSAFALQGDGSGGLIIDSGTSITYLESAGYQPLKKAFLAQVQLDVADGSDVGLDLCFALPSSDSSTVEVPKLVLHFDGAADWDLPAENYMVIDSSSGALCLTVMPSRGMSILGNFQQQNMQILYDLEGEKLSFVPAQCDQL